MHLWAEDGIEPEIVFEATEIPTMEGLVAAAKPDAWLEAAKAIMTTDTFPKVATATVKLGKAKVTINGMAKTAPVLLKHMQPGGQRAAS